MVQRRWEFVLVWVVASALLLTVSSLALRASGFGEFGIMPINTGLSLLFGALCASPVLRR